MPALPDLVFLVLMALLALLTRMVPRWLQPHTLVSDTYFHLYCARAIRDSGFRLPNRLPRVVLEHEHTYPFLYHYLLALFPLPQRLWLERFSGALFDTASLAVISAFMMWLAQRGVEGAEPRVSLLVAALFAFSPALLRIGSGPRAYNGSPRTLGQLFYLIHILSAYCALAASSVSALAISVLAGAAVFVTAKFSTQVLIFFAPLFAIFITPWYLLLPALAMVVAILLTGGRAWRVLAGQYRHSVFYLKHLQRIFIHPVARSLRDYGSSFVAEARGLLNGRSPGLAVTWFFSESHPLHLVLTVYTPFVVLPLVAASASAPTELDCFLLAWSLSAFACFVLTKMKSLMFLGEGERYLEYATFPALYLAASFLWSRHPEWLYGFLAYSILGAAFYLYSYQRQYSSREAATAEAERAFGILKHMPPGVVMPIGSFHWQALYQTQFPVLTIGGNMDERLMSRETFLLVYGHYPYPSAELARIIETFDVRYIISDRSQLRHYVENILPAPAIFHDRVKTLFDSPTLVIHQVVRHA